MAQATRNSQKTLWINRWEEPDGRIYHDSDSCLLNSWLTEAVTQKISLPLELLPSSGNWRMGWSCSKWANINQSARLLPLWAKISFIARVSLLQQHCLFKDNTWKIRIFTLWYFPLFCHWQPFYFLPIQPEHPNSPIPTFLSFSTRALLWMSFSFPGAAFFVTG